MFAQNQRSFFVSFFLIMVLLTGILGVVPAQARNGPLQSVALEYVPLALPAGWEQGRLMDVWGTGASDIYAVGYVYDQMGNGSPLLYHNDGNGWAEASPALPAGWVEGNLAGVWGASATDIYAVGSGLDGAGAALPLIYHNDGTGWTQSPLPAPVGLNWNSLHGVWGSSAGDIYAVGYGYSSGLTQMPLLYHYDGTSWTQVDLSSLVSTGWLGANLMDVWGFSTNDVYLVGMVYNATTEMPLLFHNDGTGWITVSPALPPGSSYGSLSGVWGAGAGDVHLTGVAKDAAETKAPLYYRNNGTGWTDSSPTLPAGWSGSFESVWGTSASNVYAVGTGYRSGLYVPLLYHNNGTGWIEANPPLPFGLMEGHLRGVWSSSAGNVYAVGDGFDANQVGLPLLYTPEVCASSSITVTTTEDAGAGSLRQALADVCSGGRIDFAASLAGQTITLRSTLTLDKDLTIDGSALASQISISGNGTERVFFVNPGVTASLDNLIITNGAAALDGGGIYNQGTLTVTHSVFAGNNVSGSGGAIANDRGTLTVTDGRFTGNTAKGGGGAISSSLGIVVATDLSIDNNNASRGGGIACSGGALTTSRNVYLSNIAHGWSGSAEGGAIYSTCNSSITNSTFSSNTASQGGAVLADNDTEPFLVTNSTFYGNSASIGGGIYNAGQLRVTNSTFSDHKSAQGGAIRNALGGILSLRNSILANTLGGTDCSASDGAIVAENINNLIESNGTGIQSCGTPLLSSDPLLGPLSPNGASIWTMALLTGSPAIDAGDAGVCPGIDQRGVDRPQGNGCDLGAYEYDGPVIPTFTPTATPSYSHQPLYLSLTSSQTVGGVASADEDILKFDGTNWSLFFDGSDVGVGSSDLFAFYAVDADTILMSFDSNVTVNGIAATPQDVLRFDATSLGSNTAGTFSLLFDGSDVGLSDASNEKIDALSVQPDTSLLISTNGNPVVPGISGGKDEDVLKFMPVSFGDTTSGTWSMYFDGSDVGLSETSGEDVDGLDVIRGNIYLSTQGDFSVNGVSGADEDVFVCSATSLGDVTACDYSSNLYFDGSTWGVSANDVDDFTVLTFDPLPTAVPTSTATSTPTQTRTSTATPSVTNTPTRTPTITSTPTNISTSTPSSSLYVHVLQPNGGETLMTGTTYRITWDSTPDIDTVWIGYKSCDSCLSWIAAGISNTGYYDWNVAVANIATTQFKIYVIGYDTGVGSGSDVSDNYFTLLKATPTPSQTPTLAAPEVRTYIPVADAYVNASNSAGNYGSSTTLRTDASPDIHSYLRFDVQGLTGRVTKATLRIYANSTSSQGCTVNSVGNNSWDENTITYNNAPSVGGILGSSGAFGGGEWVEIDVTSYITGSGFYNLALTTPSSTAISFASRETVNTPQLIVEISP